MNWETLSKISATKAIAANGAVLVSIPIFAGLLTALERNPSVVSLLHFFDPQEIDLPLGLVRIYLASVFAFTAQLIVQLGNVLGYGVPIEEAAWSQTAKGIEARKQAQSDTRGGNDAQNEKFSELFQGFKRKQNYTFLALRWLALVLILISAYLLLATIVRNVIITLQSVNDWGDLFIFWGAE